MSPLVLMLGAVAGVALLGVAVLVLSRRADRQLRPRLDRIAEPLARQDSELNPEVDASVFRTVQVRSGSGRFMQFVQARYPLLGVKRALPRAIAVGIVASAASWVAMWVLKIPSGW